MINGIEFLDPKIHQSKSFQNPLHYLPFQLVKLLHASWNETYEIQIDIEIDV